jgi:peptidoglycan/xylan/chitin deacetylase (PgdA/CDA1 family)
MATSTHRASLARTALNLAGGALWYLPGRFKLLQLLDSRYSLRCVVFHNVADTESPFTKGLGITITQPDFESALQFLVKHYTPVSLEDVLANPTGKGLPPRPVLVTFDDGYSSVYEFAAPLCRNLGVPAICFANAACLDNQRLALDNLVCYVFNVFGMNAVDAAVRAVPGTDGSRPRSLTEVFSHFLPSISLSKRLHFHQALIRRADIRESELASDAKLYMTKRQLRDLADFGFEIGNHTYSHVHCRCLSTDELAPEIRANNSVLEKISGSAIRSFSVPYGSSADLTTDVMTHLGGSGNRAVFLVESLANQRSDDSFGFYRVSVNAANDSTLFSEIEVLPRLRSVRNRLLGISNFFADRRALRFTQ